MGQIEDLRLFVRVIETGSISKAAIKLGIAKSAVSRRLGLMEARYNTRLIDRVPGTWQITEAGQELHQRALRVVGDMDELESDFINASADLSGPLYISVPHDFGIAFLGEALIQFKTRFPGIQLAVDFDDRTVDLARENYDFTIRITPELEGNVAGIRLGTVQHRLFASPAYLQKHTPPRTVQDLHQHPLLHFRTARRAVWDFVDEKGKAETLEFQPFLNSNSGVFLFEATLNGLGIARLPNFVAAKPEATGQLISVLPEVTIPSLRIYLVHAENRRLNRRMRVFADMMKEACLS